MSEYDRDQPQPSYVVTAPPIQPDDAATYIGWVNQEFYKLDLDAMRAVLNKRRRIARMSSFNMMIMEPRVLDNPMDFGMEYTKRDFAIVRIRPEDFDRASEQQMVVFQKMLGFIEIMSTIPLTGRWSPKKLGISCIKFYSTQSAEEAQKWRVLLERWKSVVV